MDSSRIAAARQKNKWIRRVCFILIVPVIGAITWLLYILTNKTASQDLDYSNATIVSGTNHNMTMDDSCGTSFFEALMAFENMEPNVKQINLHDKNISCVPSDAFESKNDLIILVLRGNPLNIALDRPWLRHPKLKVLDISDCGLGPLSSVVFENLPSLKKVMMAGNSGCLDTQKQSINIEIDCGAVLSTANLNNTFLQYNDLMAYN
ncbi:hypothetical protein R5R35_006712 [Gryllus longicercus]|uniref:Toll-like receptor n=1 Tax=Gryllus longicercus TaxID=2509291 RepID=A0AAN9W2E9_9ORTH